MVLRRRCWSGARGYMNERDSFADEGHDMRTSPEATKVLDVLAIGQNVTGKDVVVSLVCFEVHEGIGLLHWRAANRNGRLTLLTNVAVSTHDSQGRTYDSVRGSSSGTERYAFGVIYVTPLPETDAEAFIVEFQEFGGDNHARGAVPANRLIGPWRFQVDISRSAAWANGRMWS